MTAAVRSSCVGRPLGSTLPTWRRSKSSSPSASCGKTAFIAAGLEGGRLGVTAAVRSSCVGRPSGSMLSTWRRSKSSSLSASCGQGDRLGVTAAVRSSLSERKSDINVARASPHFGLLQIVTVCHHARKHEGGLGDGLVERFQKCNVSEPHPLQTRLQVFREEPDLCKARSGRDRAVAGARLGVLLARWLAHARRQDRDVCRRVLQSASAWTRACCRGCSVQRLMSGHMQQQRKLQDQHARDQSRGERARLCRVAIQTRVCSLVALPLA